MFFVFFPFQTVNDWEWKFNFRFISSFSTFSTQKWRIRCQNYWIDLSFLHSFRVFLFPRKTIIVNSKMFTVLILLIRIFYPLYPSPAPFQSFITLHKYSFVRFCMRFCAYCSNASVLCIFCSCSFVSRLQLYQFFFTLKLQIRAPIIFRFLLRGLEHLSKDAVFTWILKINIRRNDASLFEI